MVLSWLRALGIIRLSVLRDETTSPQRQRADIEAKAKALGSEIIGWAEDLDVSAFKIPPMRRPELAVWLNRTSEYDEIIFWKLDRFVRRAIPDFSDLVQWGAEHDIGMVSATEADLNLTGPLGRMMAIALATVAEMASVDTSTRVASAHAWLRESGRWPGGHAPFGYVVIPSADGHGKRLAIDYEALPLVREVVDRVISGEAVNAVVADWNRRKLPSPVDRVRQRGGKPARGSLWRNGNLLRIVRSPALLGYWRASNFPDCGSFRILSWKGPANCQENIRPIPRSFERKPPAWWWSRHALLLTSPASSGSPRPRSGTG
jgi:site-specific DNA recombinase